MIVLITGSRTITDYAAIATVLDRAHAADPIRKLVLGDCLTGADAHALEWAQRNDVPYVILKADWNRYGRSAGPRRNQQMVTILHALMERLSEHKPFVVAFTDKPLDQSRGTLSCINFAKSLVPNVPRVHYNVADGTTAHLN